TNGALIELSNNSMFIGGFYENDFITAAANANRSFGIRLFSDSSTFNFDAGLNTITANANSGIGVTMTGNTIGQLGIWENTITGTVDNGASEPDFNGEAIHVRLLQSATLLGSSLIVDNVLTSNVSTG